MMNPSVPSRKCRTRGPALSCRRIPAGELIAGTQWAVVKFQLLDSLASFAIGSLRYGRAELLLAPGVTQVVEVDVLTVAVDPRRDQAESVELRPRWPVA